MLFCNPRVDCRKAICIRTCPACRHILERHLRIKHAKLGPAVRYATELAANYCFCFCFGACLVQGVVRAILRGLRVLRGRDDTSTTQHARQHAGHAHVNSSDAANIKIVHYEPMTPLDCFESACARFVFALPVVNAHRRSSRTSECRGQTQVNSVQAIRKPQKLEK